MLKTLFLDLKIYEYCCTWFLQQSSFNCHLKTLVTWIRDAPGNTLLKWFSFSEQIMPLSFVQQTCTMQFLQHTASQPELHRRNSSLSPTESKVFTVQCFPCVQLYILICTWYHVTAFRHPHPLGPLPTLCLWLWHDLFEKQWHTAETLSFNKPMSIPHFYKLCASLPGWICAFSLAGGHILLHGGQIHVSCCQE